MKISNPKLLKPKSCKERKTSIISHIITALLWILMLCGLAAIIL